MAIPARGLFKTLEWLAAGYALVLAALGAWYGFEFTDIMPTRDMVHIEHFVHTEYLPQFPYEFGFNYRANEHRFVVPLVFIAINQAWFDSSANGLILVLLALNALASLLLIRILRRDQRDIGITPLAIAIIPLLMFWPAHGENLQYQVQIHLLIVYCAVFLGFLAVEGRARGATAANGPSLRRTGAAMGLLVIATFSFGYGIAAWPVLLGYGLLKRWRRSVLVLLSAGMLVMAVLYYLRLPDRPNLNDPLTLLQWPWDMLAFAAAVAGTPLAYLMAGLDHRGGEIGGIASPIVVGCAIIGILGWSWLVHFQRERSDGRARPENSAVPLLVATFGVGCCLLLGYARFEMGMEKPLHNRYMSAGLLIWIGLGIYWLRMLQPSRPRLRPLVSGGLACLIVLIAFGFTTFVDQMRARDYDIRQRAITAVLDIDPRPFPHDGEPPFLHVQPRLVRIFMGQIRERRASIFQQEWPYWPGRRFEATFTLADPAACMGEVHEVLRRDTVLRASGWAWHAAARRVPQWLVFVDPEGTIVGLGTTGGGVAIAVLAQTRSTGARFSGWTGFGRVGPSDELTIYAVLDNGEACRIGNTRSASEGSR